jgi:hypothetical protein
VLCILKGLKQHDGVGAFTSCAPNPVGVFR